ncbi:MAG: copper-binding protein [Sideroxydans sp.]|jgi:Cu/Ag efflux protein CusF
MRTLTLTFALLSAISLAQAASHTHEMRHDMSSHSATQHATGVVKALQANKIQITHEPIAALNWPAMTMWFSLLKPIQNNIKVGDEVRFEMTQGSDKQWTIVTIQQK